jgi:DNA uptake protein ComE-like DNA-binding protein
MDINKASTEELQRAFEVDGERARYIVDKRDQLGGFESWEQIKEVVPSIEDRMVENLKTAGITIGSKSGHRRTERMEGVQATSSSARRNDGEIRDTKDLNGVSREQLEEVCQIDGERADYFLEKRRELGGFRSWEQIKESVPSFEDGMIERLKNAGFRIGNDSKAA